jgi:uncharacterized protein (DUF1499 family)
MARDDGISDRLPGGRGRPLGRVPANAPAGRGVAPPQASGAGHERKALRAGGAGSTAGRRRREAGGMSRIARSLGSLGLVLGILAGLALLGAGPGYRFGLWPLGTGFAIVRYAAYAGLGAALLSLAGLVLAPFYDHRRGMLRALAGLIVGLIVVGVPWSYLRAARAAPPIHDITTDTDDPPALDALLPLRAGAPDPAAYGGQEVAALQHEAYPDIRPLVVEVPTGRAYTLALDAARAQGWRIVATAPERRRIEATDRTLWFGFVDDIVVRVTPAGTGSRIDVRSVSRVGKGDLGTNAARIRAYLERLRAQLPATGR